MDDATYALATEAMLATQAERIARHMGRAPSESEYDHALLVERLRRSAVKARRILRQHQQAQG